MTGKMCQSTTKSGDPCGAYALSSGEFCFVHDPQKSADRAAARKLGGLRRRAKHGGDPAGVPAQVRTLADVLEVLDYVLAEALALENGVQRGRLLVAICGEYTNAIMTGEMEARILALEGALKMRGEK